MYHVECEPKLYADKSHTEDVGTLVTLAQAIRDSIPPDDSESWSLPVPSAESLHEIFGQSDSGLLRALQSDPYSNLNAFTTIGMHRLIIGCSNPMCGSCYLCSLPLGTPWSPAVDWQANSHPRITDRFPNAVAAV